MCIEEGEVVMPTDVPTLFRVYSGWGTVSFPGYKGPDNLIIVDVCSYWDAIMKYIDICW